MSPDDAVGGHPSAAVTLPAPPEVPGAVVAVTGEVDLDTAPRALDTVRAALSKASPVVLDLAGVTFIDCSGLRELLLLQNLLTSQGRELHLRSPSPAVTRLLAWTGTEDRFHHTPTVPKTVPETVPRHHLDLVDTRDEGESR